MSRLTATSFALLAMFTFSGASAALAGENAVELARSLDGAKLTLEKAVGAAETASKGHAIAAMAWMDNKNVSVNVFCQVGDKTMLVPVDHTGKAGAAKAATAEQEKAGHVASAHGVEKAMTDDKTTLAKAIQSAEKETKGKATSSYAAVEDGKLTIHVTCAADGKTVHATVDGKTGKATISGKKEPASAKPGAHKP